MANKLYMSCKYLDLNCSTTKSGHIFIIWQIFFQWRTQIAQTCSLVICFNCCHVQCRNQIYPFYFLPSLRCINILLSCASTFVMTPTFWRIYLQVGEIFNSTRFYFVSKEYCIVFWQYFFWLKIFKECYDSHLLFDKSVKQFVTRNSCF